MTKIQKILNNLEEDNLIENLKAKSLSDLINDLRSDGNFKQIAFLVCNSEKSKTSVISKINEWSLHDGYDIRICLLLLSLVESKITDDVFEVSILLKDNPRLKWAATLALSLMLRKSLYGA